MLVLLLGLTLLCGLFVMVGIVGSVYPAAHEPTQPASTIDWGDLTYGFVLLGVVTCVVLVLLATMLVDARQSEPVLRFVETLG